MCAYLVKNYKKNIFANHLNHTICDIWTYLVWLKMIFFFNFIQYTPPQYKYANVYKRINIVSIVSNATILSTLVLIIIVTMVNEADFRWFLPPFFYFKIKLQNTQCKRDKKNWKWEGIPLLSPLWQAVPERQKCLKAQLIDFNSKFTLFMF